MICIAIFAIFLGITIHRADTVGWLAQESNYRFALRSARQQLEQLRQEPFQSLPPQQLKVGRDGWVQLAHGQLVPNSLKTSPTVRQLDLEKGRLQLAAPAGATVVVDYAYFVSDQGEAHTIDPNGRVTLRNSPVLKVDRVLLYQGSQSTSVGYTVQSNQLQFPTSLAGKVVQVDYSGGSVRNQVSGMFLDDQLHATSKASRCKLLFVQEAYGRDGVARMQLSLVKPQ
jgi:hypothetical protein